jgi:hypothetical protein
VRYKCLNILDKNGNSIFTIGDGNGYTLDKDQENNGYKWAYLQMQLVDSSFFLNVFFNVISISNGFSTEFYSNWQIVELYDKNLHIHSTSNNVPRFQSNFSNVVSNVGIDIYFKEQ